MKKLILTITLFLVSCASAAPEAAWPGKNSGEILKICWDNERANIEESCQNPEYVEWDHTPVTVTSDPSISGMVLHAVRAWNNILGFELFVFKKMDISADIIFAKGGEHPHIRGLTMFFKPKGKMRAGILMFNSALSSMDTYLHELGHAIGLRHDTRDTRSIMYPNNRRVFPRVQRKDKKLIIQRYSPLK